jgi:hypothetical protein
MLTNSYNIITRIMVTRITVTRIRILLMLALAAASVFGCAASPARAQGLPGSLPGSSCAPQPAGAVAWYPGEGTAEDVQGGNHGTLQGGAYFTKGGKVGSAFLLDGADEFVFVPASASLNVGAGDGLTIEMWIKPSDLGPNAQWRPLAEWNNGSAYGTHFWMNVAWNGSPGTGSLYGNLVDTNGVHHYVWTQAILTADAYQHVALTYDKNSGVARIFRNGAQVGQAAVGTFTPQTSYDFYLGKRPGWAPYQGRMDEVGVYDRALTAAEIQSIFAAAGAGKCAHTVSGRITDECGAPLAGVIVNAEELGVGGVTRLDKTDVDGSFSFKSIPAGDSYTFTPQPIFDTPGEFVPPDITFINLSRDETATFYHHSGLSFCEAPIEYLSDHRWVSATNGSNDVELDGSNGDCAGCESTTITLNGIAYGKGLGAHADSEIVYDLGGDYSSFVTDIGLDDETGPNGTVIFRVYADGVLLYDSGVMSGNSPTQSINVGVAGRQELRLVADHAGDNLLWDHADWAGARLVR